MNGSAPRDLPADLGDFVGHDDAQVRVIGLLTGSTRLAVINGPPGIGKTSLAVRMAHELAERFPDGQLFAELGNSPPADVLARFLLALGTPATRIPSDPAGIIARYRDTVAGRRVLIVLDNVARPSQVRAVLPVPRGCGVIVTGRDPLPGLPVRPISLTALPPERSHQLLAGIVGHDVAAEHPAQLAELAELCGHVPLALRIAAANLVARYDLVLTDYLTDLRRSCLSTPDRATAC